MGRSAGESLLASQCQVFHGELTKVLYNVVCIEFYSTCTCSNVEVPSNHDRGAVAVTFLVPRGVAMIQAISAVRPRSTSGRCLAAATTTPTLIPKSNLQLVSLARPVLSLLTSLLAAPSSALG